MGGLPAQTYQNFSVYLFTSNEQVLLNLARVAQVQFNGIRYVCRPVNRITTVPVTGLVNSCLFMNLLTTSYLLLKNYLNYNQK